MVPRRNASCPAEDARAFARHAERVARGLPPYQAGFICYATLLLDRGKPILDDGIREPLVRRLLQGAEGSGVVHAAFAGSTLATFRPGASFGELLDDFDILRNDLTQLLRQSGVRVKPSEVCAVSLYSPHRGDAPSLGTLASGRHISAAVRFFGAPAKDLGHGASYVAFVAKTATPLVNRCPTDLLVEPASDPKAPVGPPTSANQWHAFMQTVSCLLRYFDHFPCIDTRIRLTFSWPSLVPVDVSRLRWFLDEIEARHADISCVDLRLPERQVTMLDSAASWMLDGAAAEGMRLFAICPSAELNAIASFPYSIGYILLAPYGVALSARNLASLRSAADRTHAFGKRLYISGPHTVDRASLADAHVDSIIEIDEGLRTDFAFQ